MEYTDDSIHIGRASYIIAKKTEYRTEKKSEKHEENKSPDFSL